MIRKVFLGFVFIFLSILLFLLLTIRFAFLNPSFIFWSFDRHGVYQEIPEFLQISLRQESLHLDAEEKEAYEQIAKKVTPELAQKTTEENTRQILNFLDGQSEKIKIYLPLGQLGIETTDFYWSTDNLQSPQIQGYLDALHGKIDWLVIACLILAVILVGLFLYLKSSHLVFLLGLITFLFGLLVRIILLVLEKTLPQGTEPSAKLLSLLAGSILADAVLAWLIACGLIFLLGIIWRVRRALGQLPEAWLEK